MIDDDKLVLKNYIEDLRRFKLNSPIIYLGIAYDADQIARENIQGKIIEIQSKQALGITTAELFWKDTSNVIHTWSTLADYLIFFTKSGYPDRRTRHTVIRNRLAQKKPKWKR